MKIPLVDLKAQYQNIKNELTDAINAIITDAAFIGGAGVKEFEAAFASFCEVDYCIGTSNGTDALFCALWALGIDTGDEVIMPAHTFIATSEAVRLLGAVPVFVDVQAHSFNIDPEAVAAAIGPRTRAIVAVHLYGRPAAMKQLKVLAKRHDLTLVADSAQAHGARLDDYAVSHFAKATIFSFYPGKNIGACGDAGAIVTSAPELATRIRMIVNHGRTGKYIHEIGGTNARLDALQAAILSVKLKHLHEWNAARRNHAAAYADALVDIDEVVTPDLAIDGQHAMHLYVIRVPAAERDPLLEHLKERGIGAGIHYPVPLHLQPCNADLGYSQGKLPVTEQIVKEIISLPMYAELDEVKIAFVVETIREYFSR